MLYCNYKKEISIHLTINLKQQLLWQKKQKLMFSDKMEQILCGRLLFPIMALVLMVGAAEHIASFYKIESYSEELQYLTGEIAMEMFKNSKDLMCDDCRLNFYNYGRVKIKIKGELN